MPFRWLKQSAPLLWLFALLAMTFLSSRGGAQATSRASAARTLVLPHTIVSGERATLAVLDSNGRLVPHAKVIFSNGDHLTSDATGRALFVAPLSLGVILGSVEGVPERIPMAIISRQEAAATGIQVQAFPEAVSVTDRFEIAGRGLCGGADANQVTISGESAFVLASSPTSLIVLAPSELPPGRAPIEISCGKQKSSPFEIVFVALELSADTSSLVPGARRSLTVRVRGTSNRLTLEAKNLAPGVAQLAGGNPARVSSTGGEDNVAHFEVIGRKHGSFAISIRLVSSTTHQE